MARTRIGIVNVTGYVGSELVRILLRHPGVEIASITGRSGAGQALGDIFPHLSALDLRVSADLDDVELAFCALPHKASAESVVPLVKRGIKVIDTSADFRLKDPALYPVWYGFTHPAPDQLSQAVYGLPELYREAVSQARLVASPGCYPTSAILALAPALKHGLVTGHMVVDSKSGTSGAGRTLSLTSHFCEVNENVSAYSLGGHRHFPEITQELSAAGGKPVTLTFVPHLIPMTRGILSSCYAQLADKSLASDEGEAHIRKLYREFYSGACCTRVVDTPPQTKHTTGTNMCLVHPVVDRRSGMLIVISCLDNLVKGAAGQAVQTMNLMLGLPETASLDAAPLYP